MKKLFTSLLLLGAVTVSQAQVTVTGYDATKSTVTINFTYDGARPTPEKVHSAIEAAFVGKNAAIADLKPHERQAIKTIILTGDWNNVDIDQKTYPGIGSLGNGSIAKAVQEFSDDQNAVTLDLSQCKGFESKYVSVRDYYGASSPRHAGQTIPADGWSDGYFTDYLESDFTWTPTAQAGGSQMKDFTSTVTVTPNQSSEVSVKTVAHLYWSGGPEITITTNANGTLSWSPNPLPDGFVSIRKIGDNYYACKVDNDNDNDKQQLQNPITKYTFEVNGNEVEVPADEVANLREENGVLYYDYTLYEYEDENGSVATASTTTPHQLQSDGNGGYTYSYQKSVEVDAVCEFHISNTLNIDGIIFPLNQDKFDFIPDELFYQSTHIKKAVLGNNIVAIGNHAFDECINFEEINFPSSLREMGHQAFKKTKVTKALMAGTQLSRIRLETFELCHSLTKATFPPTLIEIQKEAFDQAALDSVDLSNCHELRMIAGSSFDQMKNWNTDNKPSLVDVKLCSHPKIIRGTSEMNGGDSHGAFHEDTAIKRVEVVGCENTCVTQCICENRGFEWDITHYQTAAPANVYDRVAELIYPNNLPACDNSGYTSSFDFFEGDYKAGTMITQETLLCYYRQIPNTGSGSGKFVWLEPDPNNPDQMVKKEETRTVTVDDRYIHNGWLEFIKTGSTTVVSKGEFLRTYSRTADDGPCQLPNDITAYRAVDYHSTNTGWVKDKKNGTHYCTNPTAAENERVYEPIIFDENDPDYTDPALYANGNRYSQLTIGGTLYLRPLVAKVANLKVDGQTVPYDDEKFTSGDESFKNEKGEYMTHKQWYDSETIYSQLQLVPGGYSYVPENTGVVLYSRNLLEEAFLVLGGDFGTETVYKEFPHTGDRYEEGRLTSDNQDNDINMLSGTFGTGVPVAPVFPWNYKDKTNYTGGIYGKIKEYRNFACVLLKSSGKQDDGTILDRNVYGWQRLQPGLMKVNRAFAQIHVNRFDNHNEGVDQMPDFTITDLPEEYYESTDEGNVGGDANLMLLSIFEDESEADVVVDGIKTVNTNVVKVNNDAWYTIQGVRVAKPTKGVYIHNGKKVVIK